MKKKLLVKKRFKIAIVCYPSIGGSGILATELGNKLAGLNHEVHFISYDEPFRLDKKNKNIYFHKVPINQYSLFKFPDYTLPLSVMISEVHHKYNLDIIHSHYAVPHATAALLAKNICENCLHSAPKVITTLHGTDISLLADDPSLKPIIKYSIEKSDAVTAVSKWLASETHKKLCPKKPVEVIYNFYDPVPVKKDKQKLRFDLGLPANDFLLIHLSNLRPVKRIPDLLRVMSKLKKEKKIKLVIASGADFTPFKSLVAKLGIEKKIILFKEVKNIAELISACNVGIFTSETESFGLSALECMSYGLPVISTDVGGVPEVAENKVSGLLHKVGDIQSIVHSVLYLRKEIELFNKLSENAQVRSQDFRSEKIVGEYVKLYRSII